MAQQATALSGKDIARLAQEKHQQRHLWLERLIDNPWVVALLVIGHILLAYTVREFNQSIGLAHVLAVFMMGLYWAVNVRFPVIYSVYAAAYIVGAEVMWRQNEFPTFWETGKYAVMVILLLTWIRTKRGSIAMPNLIYLLSLIPAVVLAVIQSFNEIHALLSSSFTGPAAIFVCVLFFNDLPISRDQLRRIFIMLAVPIAGIAGITTYLLANFDITWTGDSNNDASGFGANQVSTALGLGWMVLTYTVVMLWERKRATLLIPLVVLIPWYVSQNFFTFSRGGLLGALVAVAITLLHLLYIPSRRVLLVVATILAVATFLIFFPALDNTTQGRLSNRYQVQQEETLNELTSNRQRILEDEIRVFMENPITGAGIGIGQSTRDVFGTGAASHTEFTRLLADHGILGVVANVMMLAIAIQGYLKQKNPTARGIVAGLFFWSFFYMTQAATRTVAVSFTLGLMTAYLMPHLNLDGTESVPGQNNTPKEIVVKPIQKAIDRVPLNIPVMPLDG